MTADEELVEELAGLVPGATAIVDAGEYEDVEMMIEGVQYLEPTRDTYGWDEGELYVTATVDQETAGGYGWVMCEVSIVSKTDRGEWRPPTVEFAEEWAGNISSAEEADDPYTDWTGEQLEIQSSHIVTAEATRYRREALRATGPVRPQSMRRLVMIDAVVRYVANEGRGDVWAAYEEDVEEASLSGLLEWLTAEGLVRLLEEEFEAVFPDRVEMIDCTQRVVRDVLHQLRYFRS
ncbi:hypothetical protein [Haloarcula marina]|uniref:hypothetical protein n=1 Tax=Haloarcula marina TaxID=2961574 RepID=UPI0020B8BFE4|nr:hypothetical protein [Halomicroarcula marina]